jgi:demethylmenaquinone methyltransferase / 2-methoxy-6-polyprenyl-1,4-benzoquinol methylase
MQLIYHPINIWITMKKEKKFEKNTSSVKKLFEKVAFSYDLQNSVLSMGQDIAWRKRLAALLDVPSDGLILDAATGTAEVALEIERQHPGTRIIGVDFSPSMLEVGIKKIRNTANKNNMLLAAGDICCLPFDDMLFDAITISFGIRNVENRSKGIMEFYRVLKPGGKLYIMEFAYPDNPVMKSLYSFYFRYILPPLGNFIARTPGSYNYLVESVDGFPSPENFMDELSSAGFREVEVFNLTFGIARIYRGIK